MSVLDTVSDAINPIVVKELRQAVQSRFVVAVLMLFLLVQLVFMGIVLMMLSLHGNLHSVDYQAGRTVFTALQAILLGTCMLCIPAYSGFRLAAERSDFHVDLFYISALRPRSIVAGKYVASLVLTLLIFAACAPFMTFTYFLRGIDLESIFVVIALDFLVVAATVMLALFLAVVPAGRVLKVILAVIGLLAAITAFGWGLGGTTWILGSGVPAILDNPENCVFWLAVVVETVGAILFLFAASVGLLSPLSANRILPLRLMVTAFTIVTGPMFAWCASWLDASWPLDFWVSAAGMTLSLCLLIAINERESWAARVARRIPRRCWLRPAAFLFYSGAAGGVLWASLLSGATFLVVWLLMRGWPVPLLAVLGTDETHTDLTDAAVSLGYVYSYALTAVFLRNTLLRIPHAYTWMLALGLTALGSGLPFLVTFLIFYRDWEFWQVYPWLLPNPVVGSMIIIDDRPGPATVVIWFVACWAALATIVNARWFFRQIRRFRPYAGSQGMSPETLRPILSTTPMDATRTAL